MCLNTRYTLLFVLPLLHKIYGATSLALYHIICACIYIPVCVCVGGCMGVCMCVCGYVL